MRCAFYNQMFGLDGRSFLSTLIGHWAVHYQKKSEKIWKRVKLSNTIKVIRIVNPDFLGIIEVLEGQEKELKKRLRKQGYRFFYLGKGHKTKHSDLCVQELIASKTKGIQKYVGKWPMENKLGGGGGFAHVYYPDENFHLFLVHLGLPSRSYYWKQIRYLNNYLKRINGRIVILGDFNLSYKDIKNYFNDFKLVSGQIKSCSTTPIIRRFYSKDVDHIFVKGFKSVNNGAFEGYSDHKLIYADLK